MVGWDTRASFTAVVLVFLDSYIAIPSLHAWYGAKITRTGLHVPATQKLREVTSSMCIQVGLRYFEEEGVGDHYRTDKWPMKYCVACT